MPKNTLAGLSLTHAARGLRDKAFSASELLEDVLAQRHAVEPKIAAFLSTDDEAARRQAKDVDDRRAHGDKLSPLAGIPIAIKDNFNVTGTETTAGSRILKQYVSPYDATAVARLRTAGCVFVGKTNLDEFAMGSSTEHSAFQVTKNPWDTTRVPGGSSGGSAAAVAADMASAALGSDTGGSVRQPAALTGTVGLKPTYGRISRYGVVALASSLDVVGTLTKTVEDAALLLEHMAGADPMDSTCRTEYAPSYSHLLSLQTGDKPLTGIKLGLPKEYFGEGLDPEVGAAVKAGIDKLVELGATVTDVTLPHSQYALPTYYVLLPCEASANLARYDGIRYGASITRDASVQPKDLAEVYGKSRAAGFGPEVTRRIMLGTYALSEGYYDQYYRKALKVRTLVRRDFLEAFKEVNVLVTPTTPTVAFKIGEKEQDPLSMYLNDVMTVAVNVAGVPALSLPCGFVGGGPNGGKLPVGMQLITEDLNEETLFKVGHAFQQATDWHGRKPTLA